MTTTTQTTQRHGHPADVPATAEVFAVQHLIYLLPAVFLFLALRAVAMLQLGALPLAGCTGRLATSIVMRGQFGSGRKSNR